MMVKFTLAFFFSYAKECWECFWFVLFHPVTDQTFMERLRGGVRYSVSHMKMAVLLYQGLWRYDRCREARWLVKRDGGWRKKVNEDI